MSLIGSPIKDNDDDVDSLTLDDQLISGKTVT